MIHAETLCQALTILEVSKVLGKQAEKDSSRAKLFHDYFTLTESKLAGIYADWRVRSQSK